MFRRAVGVNPRVYFSGATALASPAQVRPRPRRTILDNRRSGLASVNPLPPARNGAGGACLEGSGSARDARATDWHKEGAPNRADSGGSSAGRSSASARARGVFRTKRLGGPTFVPAGRAEPWQRTALTFAWLEFAPTHPPRGIAVVPPALEAQCFAGLLG